MCEMVCQIFQKNQEEKRIEEEQAANARYCKILACCDDDDDYDYAITSVLSTEEPVNSLSIGDEHLDTILATESDEVIKSGVEDLVSILSESEGENGCDVPSCFTTFSNILFDADYDFESVDDQSLHNEDVSEKIFSNPLFEEEIISIRIDQHHFNAESDLVESMLNRNSSVISSSSKIDSLLDEFVGELTLLKSIPPGIDKADYHPKNEIHFSERLLYDNSSPRPPEEFVFENCNAEIESFSPSPIPIENSDSHMEEIDLSFNPDDPMPPSIEDDDNDSEGDNLFLERLLHDDPIPLSDTLDFSNVVRFFLPFFTYPVTSSILHPFGNKDTIFDPGITINHFYSFKPGLSHRCGDFKKFNTRHSHLNEWSMIINGKNITILDVLLFHFYPP
uniref:Uncharacterized protein n=1 Tax=Tanacetum cinerariifolium TaxID=118510 RepID=A0A6L2KVT8_TANCI|nr:hypothetical protein [Tanacetum cinerariifolium]